MIPASISNIDEVHEHNLHTQAWRPFQYFNYYRIMLAVLFIAAYFLSNYFPALGSHAPQLYIVVSFVYLFISIVCSLSIHRRWPSFQTLAYILVFFDIIALTLIMHASGGLKSGLGMLIIVAIAGNSLLIAGRTANLFAALAALAVLTEQAYSHISGTLLTNYTQAGILGTALFATSLLASVILKRLQDTQELATQRGIDLENLAQLNEHVIRRMQSGIVVVDEKDRIRLMNEAAWHMLGLPAVNNSGSAQLGSVSTELTRQLEEWKNHSENNAGVFRTNASGIDILPHFTRLGQDTASGTLVFLEDASRMAQQAQQIKLASLGRLTASIAHEIRNPLGAISHAEQLLAESEHLDKGDRRLTEIIHNNSARVNAIIENVMQLSRKGNSLPEDLLLLEWLESFMHDFAMSLDIPVEELSCSVTPDTIRVNFDNTQLHQVIWNLCQNAIRYSAQYQASPKVEIVAALDNETQQAVLDVIDHGPGIDTETAEKIFEPFFTTDAKGSGLGLYIARELCEANRARLSCIPVPGGGSCFRIEFATSVHATQPVEAIPADSA